jgi:hypothetical protein
LLLPLLLLLLLLWMLLLLLLLLPWMLLLLLCLHCGLCRLGSRPRGCALPRARCTRYPGHRDVLVHSTCQHTHCITPCCCCCCCCSGCSWWRHNPSCFQDRTTGPHLAPWACLPACSPCRCLGAHTGLTPTLLLPLLQLLLACRRLVHGRGFECDCFTGAWVLLGHPTTGAVVGDMVGVTGFGVPGHLQLLC